MYLPLTIRYLTILFGFFVIYSIVGYIALGDVFDRFNSKWNMANAIIGNVAEVLFYLWLRRHIIKVSTVNNE